MIDLSHRAAIHAEDGEITFITRRPIIVGVVLSKLLERIALLGRDLSSEGPEVPSRLLANAMSEELVNVRYHNLDLLLREYPTSEQAQDGLRIAWDSRERGLRYLAAIRRGSEGLAFLVETADAKSEPATLRVMVLRHLVHHAPRETMVALLRRTLKDDSAILVRTSAELIGRLRDRGAIPALTSLATRWSTNEDTRIRAIEALGNISDPSVERFILDFIGIGRYDFSTLAIKSAAADALGKIGTRGSIKALRRLKQQYRGAIR